MSVRTRLKDVTRRILALAVERRLRDLDPAQRLALFNLDTTRVDETVIFTCSYVTRQQLVAMADRVRRETRAVRRLRFGKRWVTLLEADVLGSSHVEIIMTALAAAGARIVLHPSVCRAVRPELRPGDLCLIAEADGRDDPVCRAIAAPSVIPADPELLERMAQGLKGMANGGGMRVHRVRTHSLPVFGSGLARSSERIIGGYAVPGAVNARRLLPDRLSPGTTRLPTKRW